VLFEQSTLGLIVYAPDGRLLTANQTVRGARTMRQMAGYNVLQDDYLAAAGQMSEIRRAFAGEPVELAPLYYDPPPAPGAVAEPARWVRSTLYPVKDRAGAVREVVAMVEDVTAQVQAHQSLEQQVEERTRELSTVLEVSHDMTSTLDLQPLLGVILAHLRTVVGYHDATIMLLEGSHLSLLGYWGPLLVDSVVGLRFPLATALANRAVVEGRGPVVIPDIWDDHDPLARSFRQVGEQDLNSGHSSYTSWLGVPLIHKEHVVGMIGLSHTVAGFFTERHARLALAFANQAAVAIENARLYARTQQVAILEERARLARDLHDSVTQTLFSASLIADVLPRLWQRDPSTVLPSLEEVRLLTRGALAEMRTLLLELRPAALTEGKLSDLLQQLVEALAGRKRLAVTLDVEGMECAIPADLQVALYRVAQEALNNCAKHARATRVEVQLCCGNGAVELRIDDDGCGFDVTRVPADHFGLRIMAERVEAVGAMLSVVSRPGHGTQVRAVWRGRQGEECT
jgi:two-component system nitrate/nitrite sensor histidine kinase NarX